MAIVAAIGAVISAGATVASVLSQRKAAKQQRRLSRVQARRQQLNQIRSARIQRGAAINVAAQTGGLGGSAAEGAGGSVLSQLGGNISFLDTVQGLQQSINRALANSATFGALADVSADISGAAGGVPAIRKGFSS